MLAQPVATTNNRRQIDLELDVFEGRLAELRNLYEQHFTGILIQPPTKLHDEAKREIRHLLKAPFKNSASRFRLRMIISRYHCYATYWEKVLKQKEDGTYSKDLFKAELRDKLNEEERRLSSSAGKVDQTFKQLFKSVQGAMNASGLRAESINYEKFKNSIEKKMQELKAQNPGAKISIKVAVNGGKVSIKASASTGN